MDNVIKARFQCKFIKYLSNKVRKLINGIMPIFGWSFNEKDICYNIKKVATIPFKC